jgi:AP-5 complex subunit beta-1
MKKPKFSHLIRASRKSPTQLCSSSLFPSPFLSRNNRRSWPHSLFPNNQPTRKRKTKTESNISSQLPTSPSMEKQPSFPTLSAQDWDSLIDDFSSGDPSRRSKYQSLPIVDLSLHSLSRRDLPSGLKLALLHFLDQHLPSIPLSASPFPSLLSALRSFLPSPDPFPLKEQLLITTTSLFVSMLDSPSSPYLQSLTELLLTLINRPNHGPDRQTRNLACESLRELENAFPCLLSEILGHVWVLAQAERTHVAQSYLLLLAQISRNVVVNGILSSSSSILSTSTPLTPFTIPQIALSDENVAHFPPSDVNLREIRRVLAFLLDRPRDLSPGAISELTSILVDIADALEECVSAISALLKVNFSCLLSCHHPLLDHSILSLYHHFSDAFNEDDVNNVARRLQLSASDTGQRLIFRLLPLHWLFGSTLLACHASSPASLPGFYPQLFDPLAVKAKKLDVISVISSERDEAASLLEDGLVCVSSFRWLPGWSTETGVAFRAMHKLLVCVMPHDGYDNRPHNVRSESLMECIIFIALEVVIFFFCIYSS